jgi:hypothetical protein
MYLQGTLLGSVTLSESCKVNLAALAGMRLLHPAKLRGQTGRWREMLSETTTLLQMLSKGNTPTNAGAATAELLRSQGYPGAAAAASAGKASGFLHGVPLRPQELRESARNLSYSMSKLVGLLSEEVGRHMGSRTGCAAIGVISRICSKSRHDLGRLQAGSLRVSSTAVNKSNTF